MPLHNLHTWVFRIFEPRIMSLSPFQVSGNFTRYSVCGRFGWIGRHVGVADRRLWIPMSEQFTDYEKAVAGTCSYAGEAVS